MLKYIFTLKIKDTFIFSFGEKVAVIDNSKLTVLVEPNKRTLKHLEYICSEFDLDLINNYKNQ